MTLKDYTTPSPPQPPPPLKTQFWKKPPLFAKPSSTNSTPSSTNSSPLSLCSTMCPRLNSFHLRIHSYGHLLNIFLSFFAAPSLFWHFPTPTRISSPTSAAAFFASSNRSSSSMSLNSMMELRSCSVVTFSPMFKWNSLILAVHFSVRYLRYCLSSLFCWCSEHYASINFISLQLGFRFI